MPVGQKYGLGGGDLKIPQGLPGMRVDIFPDEIRKLCKYPVSLGHGFLLLCYQNSISSAE